MQLWQPLLRQAEFWSGYQSCAPSGKSKPEGATPTISCGDAEDGRPLVMVVGYRCWRDRLGGRQDVLEKMAITVIAGSRDTVAPPGLVRSYHDALVDAGKSADWILVDGEHGIFLDPVVIEATGAVLAADRADAPD